MNELKKRLLICLSIVGLFCFKIDGQNLPRIQEGVTRAWIGPEYWTNPLMNWQLSDSRLECTHGGWVNELHSLTHQLKETDGDFRMSVNLGLMDRGEVSTEQEIFAGFKFGAMGHRNDYRSNVLHDIAGWNAEDLMKEPPVEVGITTEGRLRIGTRFSEKLIPANSLKDASLELAVNHSGKTVEIKLTVKSKAGKTESMVGTIKREQLGGNVALACHPVEVPRMSRKDNSDIDHQTFWFSDWDVRGEKVVANLEQTYEPILWTQYTVHRNVLKMLAFFVPLEAEANDITVLQVKSGSKWATVAESSIDPISRTALFRVEDWDQNSEREYRVAYRWNSVDGEQLATWGGLVRPNSAEQQKVSLAGLSCSNSELFPNRFLEENLIAQDPDLVYFSGDQIYEPCGGYGISFANTEADVPRSALNYLGKFWYTGLSFRELMKDRPTVMIPDDHDVYSNDLWGKGGVAMPGDQEANENRCFGGYRMHPTWVKMVEYTQMGHHPDPYDATPVARGIGTYYTSLDIGEVSFALVNDRKFKSAPGDVIDAMEPLFAMRGGRNLPKLDTINEKNFDTRKLDRPSLTLLGKRQLDFIKEWGRNDASLRAVLSQSPYCQPHHLMVADFDSNGWPQSGRNRALETIRETGAVMIHGDLHFATLVQQGVDDWEDSGWSFTLPAVSTATHRAWRPDVEPQNLLPGMPEYTGRFLDGWGNKVTIWAAANPYSFLIEDDYVGEGRATLDFMRNAGLGYGMVEFNTGSSEVTFESWPVYGELRDEGAREQHPGFPKTIAID
jgi:alkaline phosphatase D